MILVRDIAPDELDWLLILNNQAVPHVNHLDRGHLDELLTMACYARLAMTGGDPAGALIALWPGTGYDSANYQWFSQRFEHFLYIDRVIVAKAARGKGIGQALYEDIESFAGGRTAKIACEVNSLPPNPVSMGFHRASGFIPIGEQQSEGGAKRVVMMAKFLDLASCGFEASSRVEE